MTHCSSEFACAQDQIPLYHTTPHHARLRGLTIALFSYYPFRRDHSLRSPPSSTTQESQKQKQPSTHCFCPFQCVVRTTMASGLSISFGFKRAREPARDQRIATRGRKSLELTNNKSGIVEANPKKKAQSKYQSIDQKSKMRTCCEADVSKYVQLQRDDARQSLYSVIPSSSEP